MKKLKLKLRSSSFAEVLTRDELKSIFGGNGSGSGPCPENNCPPNTFICYCGANNQFSCVNGSNVAEAMLNFLPVCNAYQFPRCSATWTCD